MTKSYTVTGTMDDVVAGVDVDIVMRSVTMLLVLCVGMGCVIGEGGGLALTKAGEDRRSERGRGDLNLAIMYLNIYERPMLIKSINCSPSSFIPSPENRNVPSRSIAYTSLLLITNPAS